MASVSHERFYSMQLADALATEAKQRSRPPPAVVVQQWSSSTGPVGVPLGHVARAILARARAQARDEDRRAALVCGHPRITPRLEVVNQLEAATLRSMGIHPPTSAYCAPFYNPNSDSGH